ncbi:MAG: hypothetical protein LBR08_08820, partial [Bacteroidales bacterium]|nr:hypothetical protein [Bacteroidales bacterium]
RIKNINNPTYLAGTWRVSNSFDMEDLISSDTIAVYIRAITIYIRAIAIYTRAIAIYIRAIAIYTLTIGIYILTIGIYIRAIAIYIRAIAIYILQPYNDFNALTLTECSIFCFFVIRIVYLSRLFQA